MTTVHVNFQYVLCSGIELDVEAEVDVGRAPRFGDNPDPGDDPQIMSMDITLHGKPVDVSGLFEMVTVYRAAEGPYIEHPAVEYLIEQAAIDEALDEEGA